MYVEAQDPLNGRLQRFFAALVPLVIAFMPVSVVGQPDAGILADSGAMAKAERPSREKAESVDEHEATFRRTLRIGEAATHTRVILQRTRTLMRPKEEVADIARELPHLAEDIEQLGKSDKLAQVSQLSPRELAEARREWFMYTTTFEEWHGTLSERAATLEKARGELEELRHSWVALRNTGDPSDLSETLATRIATSLESIRAADAVLDNELNSVLELEDKLAELTIIVEDVSEQIRAATSAYRERLFVRDSPPVWVGLGGGERERSRGARARGNPLQRAWESLAILTKQLPIFYVLLLVLCVFAGLMMTLRRRSAEWPAQEDIFRLPRDVIARPFSASLILVLLLASYVVENAPLIFSTLILFLIVVPFLRVLPRLSKPSVRPLLYFIVGLLFVDRIERFLGAGNELRRVLLLVKLGVTAVVFFLWLRRNKGEDERLMKTLRAIVGTGFIVAATGFLANVLGFAFLARTLLRGMTRSAYMAVTLVAAILVIRSLLVIGTQSRLAHRVRSIRLHHELILKRLLRLLSAGAALLWFKETLAGFGLWTLVFERGGELLEKKWQIGSASFSLGSIVLFFLILAASIAATRLVRFALETDVFPALQLEAGLDGAISMLARYITFGFGLLLALASLGIDTHQIAIIAGALGVGVGFGLQGIVSNFIAGLILMLERPVRIGDFIEIGPLIGRVDRIGLRASRVRAMDGAEVIVPNERLISRELVNWTLSDRRRRVEVRFSVTNSIDPRRVLEIMRGVAESHADLLSGTPPTVYFQGFGENTLQFILRFWTGEFENWQRLQSEMGLYVHDALKNAGIQASPSPAGSAPNPASL